MTTYFISRHRGAKEWIEQQGILIDQSMTHFDPKCVIKGDIVIGTLPVNLIAEICQRKGRYLHLAMQLPAEMRGKELSMADMNLYQACLKEYHVTHV